MAYTFKLTLLGTSDPVITRVFDVPAWFTFRQLHYTIQYAMGPWDDAHLHEFSFEMPLTGERSILNARKAVLKIGSEPEQVINLPGVPTPRPPPFEIETNIQLSDVFDADGRLHNVVAPNGNVLPLFYLYDFGVRESHSPRLI